MPWQKGQSGNPNGAKAKVLANGLSLRDMARQHTELALGALIKVVTSGESEASRVAAAQALLDRGWGKPAQSVELTGAAGGPIQTQALDVMALSETTLRDIASAPLIGETMQ